MLVRRARSQLQARHVRLILLMTLLGSLAATLGGCANDNEAEFVISEVERHEQCLSSASPIRPEMFTARPSPNGVGVFMQTGYRLPSTSDSVYLQVYQPDEVYARPGEPIELSNPLELTEDDEEFDEPPIVRGSVLFAEACPELNDSFALLGSVIFEELGTEDGEIVEGSLVDGQILSVRDEEVVAQIEGTWRFTIQQGLPLQHFPTFDDEIPVGPAP